MVEMFSPEDGALLLLRRAALVAPDVGLSQVSVRDRELALQITQELGGLSLALDQAGAYLEETGSSLADYQQLYQRHRMELLKKGGGLVTNHPEPVATTWSLSFARVESRNPAAADLLRCCAYLAPDAIPETIIIEGASHLGPHLASVGTDSYLLNQSIEVLRAYSFIRREVSSEAGNLLSVDRLVQAMLRDAIDEQSKKQWAERAVHAINAAFPDVEHQNWPLCDRLLPHALRGADLIKEYDMDTSEAARLLNQTAFYLNELARYQEAEPLLQRALAIREQQLGETHPDTATSLNNLAELYRVQGKYEQAEPLYQRALAIREQQLGQEHPLTATSLNNLAELYKAQGKYEQAEPLLLRALAIREQQLGQEHPLTANSLNNLALFYLILGKYEQAEPLLQRALVICERQLGSQHPNTATSLGNLAALYDTQGKHEQAEPLLQRALAIREQQLGESHPDTATSLNSLAVLYHTQGKYEQAEPLLQRALAIREQQLGESHPDTADSLNNLAELYNAQGKYEQAEPLLQRALAIREQQLGPEHPNTATSLGNLAGLYYTQGKYEQAEPLLQRALAIDEKALGLQHQGVSTDLNNLAELYRVQGKYEQAEPLLQRALAIDEKVLGLQHPSLASSLNNLALLYEAQSKYGKAEPLYRRALAICEQQLGSQHSNTQSIRKNYASLLRTMGRDTEGALEAKRMPPFQEIDPEEISSFVPQQEDLFWKNNPLELDRLHFQIIGTRDHISVAMILNLFEYIKTSQITVDDTHIFQVAGASINVKEPRISYFLGVLAYKLRNFTKDRNLQALCLYSLGSASTSLHKPKQALSALLEAKQIFTELGNEEGIFSCNQVLVPVYLDLEKPGEAAKLLEENKSRVEKTGDLLDLANTNYQLAGLYYETGKYPNALQCFELARSTFITLANTAKHYSQYREYSLKTADCHQVMAVIYNAQDMREYAIQHLEIARDIFSRFGSSDSEEGLARCNVSLGVSYSGLNQEEKALGLYQEAETIFQRLGLELQAALCKKNMAAIYDSNLGDQETSLKLYEQARLIYEQHGIQHKVQAIDRDIAIVKRRRGKQPRGYQGIGEIKSSIAKEKVIAFVSAVSGGMTQADEIINLGEALLTELKEEEEPRFVWQIHFHLARTYRTYASLWSYYAVGNPLFRITLERAGFSLESFITSLPDEKRTLWNRLTQERRFNEITFIEAFYDDPHILAIEEGREGELAEEDAQRATEKLMILYYFAYFKRHKFENLEHAQKHIQAAIRILERLRATYVSEQAKIDFMADKHDIFNFAIDICLDLEEYLSAFVQVERAKSRSFVEMLANTNIRVPSSTLPLALLNREQELVDYLMGKVQEIKNMQKSHPLMDRRGDVFHISHSLGNRDEKRPPMYTPSYDEVHRELEEIRSLFIKTEPEYVSLRRGESFDPQGLRNFLRSQTKKTAIIELYMGGTSVHVTEAGDTSDPLEKSSFFDEVLGAKITYGMKGVGYMQLQGQQLLALVWGSQSDELFMHRTILTSENLGNLVHKALYEIRQQEPGTNFAELGRQLLQPLQGYIQGYELLIIIPYGPLHNIPFHALPYQEKTLIDFFEVVYTPSLAVLHQCRNKDAAPGNSSFVLGYNNREQDYINYIEEEAEEVAMLLDTQALLGEKATKQAVISHSQEKRFVHLACHAEFSPSQPMASSVYLAHGEQLSASEFSSLQLNADLVTLSACETGLTQAFSGDELMGLTRSLLYAGAKSVLVSLWRVASASTKEFMCRFYELLLQGMNKSTALRQVQIEMRDKYEQPLYWSPFILVGDWQ